MRQAQVASAAIASPRYQATARSFAENTKPRVIGSGVRTRKSVSSGNIESPAKAAANATTSIANPKVMRVSPVTIIWYRSGISRTLKYLPSHQPGKEQSNRDGGRHRAEQRPAHAV